MPTKYTPGLRVSHKTFGLGTIIDVTDEDRVTAEFDDGPPGSVRTFMLSLGTLTPADEHPPTDQVQKPEAALLRAKARSLTTASPEAAAIAKSVMQHGTSPGISVTPMENTMPDPLIIDMDAAIAERGKGSGAALCATLGLAGGSYKNWRKHGRIPENRRDGVRAWIDKPQITAIHVEKAKPEAKKKIKAPIYAPVKPSIPPATSMPTPAHHLQTVQDLCKALGIKTRELWLQDGPTMVKVEAVILHPF